MKITKTYPIYLKEHIRFFFSIEASNAKEAELIQPRLPDGTLDLMFDLGSPVLMSRNGIEYFKSGNAMLTGLHDACQFVQYSEEVHLVCAVFAPGYAHYFVNDTLAHYMSSYVDASLVYGNKVNALKEQLREKKEEKEKHYLLEKFLLESLKEKKQNKDERRMSAIVQQIHEAEGHVEVKSLCKDHFMSERNFRRRFLELVGMGPKQYSRIIRIKAFSKYFEQQRCNYSDIIYKLGYTDQSHFNKEFSKMTGVSPTSYFNGLNKIGSEFIHLI